MNLRHWLSVIGFSLLGFTIFLDITIVSNALPAIQQALGANHIQAQWVLNALFLSLSCMMLIVGRLGDIYGSKVILYTCTVVFIIASIGAGMSTNIHWLLFFRFLQGISSATISVNVSLLTQTIPQEHHSKAMGIFSSITGSGLALGPVIGGLIVQYLHWSWIFYINVPILILGLLLVVPNAVEIERPDTRERFDYPGAITFILGMASFILGFTHIQANGFDFASLLYFVVAAVAFISFVAIEKRSKAALVHFPKILNRTFLPAATACATCGLIISSYLYFDPLYFQTQLGLSASVSGLYMLIVSACVVFLAPFAGMITNKFNAKTDSVIVVAFAALAGLVHAFLGSHYEPWLIILALLPFGISWGNVNVGPVIAVTQSTDPKESGMALGALWTIFNIGSSAGLALTSTIYNHSFQATNNFASSFSVVNWWIFGFCLLSTIYIATRMKITKFST